MATNQVNTVSKAFWPLGSMITNSQSLFTLSINNMGIGISKPRSQIQSSSSLDITSSKSTRVGEFFFHSTSRNLDLIEKDANKLSNYPDNLILKHCMNDSTLRKGSSRMFKVNIVGHTPSSDTLSRTWCISVNFPELTGPVIIVSWGVLFFKMESWPPSPC